jgi:hypothetical protein
VLAHRCDQRREGEVLVAAPTSVVLRYSATLEFHAQPSCFKAHVSGQILVKCRILSPSNSIT